jgi:uncharacterized membrane protein YkoI
MKNTRTLVGLIVAAVSPVLLGAAPTEKQLARQAKITRNEAEHIALAKVPNGRTSGGELEREHGHLVWSFDISQAGVRDITEVQVDAKSGKIVSVKTETPKEQAQEAAADKKK